MGEYKLIRKVNRERKKINRKRIINQDIFKVSVFFTILFFALIGFLGVFLIFQSGSVINNTYNKRSESLKNTVHRGSILAADGTALAVTDIGDDGTDTRRYPYGDEFFHVVGFDSKGGLGIESSYNYYLLTSHADIFSRIGSEFSSSKLQGDNIVTTLDVSVQQAMYDAIGDNEGAAIAINASTGAIIGMVSKPDHDPNSISEDWQAIIEDENNSILLNRATQAAFTPGSTFKIFTLLEYYRQNNGNVGDFEYVCEGILSEDGHVFGCPNGNAHGYENLRSAFAFSCNCAFSEIGTTLDLERFAADNKQMLFNTDLDIDIASGKSSFSLEPGSSRFMVMQTAFGQGETLVTPLHLAMVTIAIANNGVLMKPHLVSHVADSEGNTVKSFKPSVYGRLLSEEEAAFMKDCMRAVVTDGTAIILSYDGNYYAYGKTGTAETKTNKEENYDHSWFTGFAENNGTVIVVCAMIENMEDAGITGLSVAKSVFDTYFN